jgi:probable phosphomutase (TIGR03848 family)
VTTVLLVRHGLTTTTGQVLTGWTPGIGLDDRGKKQAETLAARLDRIDLDAIVTSPLQRCRETAQAIADRRSGQKIEEDDRLGECEYGEWTGQTLTDLQKDPLWAVVQRHPSAVTFPGGESMLDMQHRAVSAVREYNATLGQHATYLICSHGDVIKAIVADSLGLHLDQSQRIQVDPCSLTVIRYTPLRPFLLKMNDTGEIVLPKEPEEKPDETKDDGDAMVGGGAGTQGTQDDARGAEGAQDDGRESR